MRARLREIAHDFDIWGFGDVLVALGMGLLFLVVGPIWLVWNFWPLPIAFAAMVGAQHGVWWSWLAAPPTAVGAWVVWQCLCQFFSTDDENDGVLFELWAWWRDRGLGCPAD